MIFTAVVLPINEAKGMKTYSFDTNEDLKVGDAFTTPSYAGKVLQVDSIGPKDMSKVVPYKIKEIVVAPAPAIETVDKNLVYCTKVN